MNVLLPMVTTSSAEALMRIAAPLLACYRGRGTVVSVVEVERDRSLSEGALKAQRRRRLVRKLTDRYPEQHLVAAVRTAYSVEEGIRAAVADSDAGLLLLDWPRRSRAGTPAPAEALIEQPPCDLAVLKAGRCDALTSVLLPVRGGPHAELALRLAQALAAQCGAHLTLLHVVVPLWSSWRRSVEERFYREVQAQVWYANTRQVVVESPSIETVLTEHAAQHDLVVMGAAARDNTSPSLLGRIPTSLAQALDSSVLVVKTAEPVTARTFDRALPVASDRDLSQVVDRWFAENTYHSHEFRSIPHLLKLKEQQGRTISLAVPTLNEEHTVGKILSTIKRNLVDRYPLLDELIVIDSGSDDRTVEIVENLGIRVYQHPEILPNQGSYAGKGEALWKSLFVTTGDIVAWVDSDITGFHPKFVYGLLGPLLAQPALGFVKGFYRRPLNLGEQRLTTGGGRVTELTARPLINLFYPELSGLVQPLAGEMAGRRDVLEAIPFFTGYGVETGLLIDLLDHFGLRAIAQADLEERVHRNQSLFSLSKMAFAIVQVVMRRLGDRERLHLLEDMNTSMKLIHYSPAELFLEVKEIEEHERPPIRDLPEYAARWHRRDDDLVATVSGSGEV